MTRPQAPRMDASVVAEVTWLRAKQLRMDGLGSERVVRRLMAEGYDPVPTRNILWNRMQDERWEGPPLRVGREGGFEKPMPVLPPAPDTSWREARKRCEVCWGVSEGETCPNGHPFPSCVSLKTA